MTLLDAELGKEYRVTGLNTDDEELENFLFTLGCYEGTTIVVVSNVSESYVVSIKDGRYNISADLAETISIA
ncbi:MAG: FeoA family protein [Eubacteriales bacterium]